MIIQDKNTVTGELSYFEMTLLLYLKESHPHIAGDKELVQMRADEAAGSYERAIRDGLSVTQALELARHRSLSGLALFQIRYGFRGRVGVFSRSTARKMDWFLPESIAARRNSIQQISHR